MTDTETAANRSSGERAEGAPEAPRLPEFDNPPDSPWELMRGWIQGAVQYGVADPFAAVLATADANGRPSTRVLHLAEPDSRGLVFGGDGESRKGRDLAARPYASATFFWFETFQQLTVAGVVERLAPEESDRLFAKGGRNIELAVSAVSRQSEPLPDEAAFRAAAREVAEAAGDGTVRRADRWTGWRLVPETIEFWQGSPDRLHRRLRYERGPSPRWNWTHQRLQP
ncbi:pyridoxal 5'-phosphate synthase [Streptomyces sp. B6B3]|uniref:pyridoxal 5'-phosphate synthase n=1 Tax=Streptomyces sp. B6B3 TaxID=3153570 RepID=UPI00325DFD40